MFELIAVAVVAFLAGCALGAWLMRDPVPEMPDARADVDVLLLRSADVGTASGAPIRAVVPDNPNPPPAPARKPKPRSEFRRGSNPPPIGSKPAPPPPPPAPPSRKRKPRAKPSLN